MIFDLFGSEKPVIGVIHSLPLPGSARHDGNMESVCLRAEQEAAAYATGGVHGLIIENFFDAPFTKGPRRYCNGMRDEHRNQTSNVH